MMQDNGSFVTDEKEVEDEKKGRSLVVDFLKR